MTARDALDGGPGGDREACPSCERDLSHPGQPGHECYTPAERRANIAARLTSDELAYLGNACLGGARASPLMERAVSHLVARRSAEALAADREPGLREAAIKAEALREAAEAGPNSTPTDYLWRMWLLKRAAALAPATPRPAEGEGDRG